MPALQLDMLGLTAAIGKAIDASNPGVARHHQRVATIGLALARVCGLPARSQAAVAFAALVHDVGALTFLEKRELSVFDVDSSQEGVHRHAEIGYRLLAKLKPFAEIARIVRHHHARFDERGESSSRRAVPIESHVIHLADRIDVGLEDATDLLGRREEIEREISGLSGSRFSPRVVEAFLSLSRRDSFWLDVMTVGDGDRGLHLSPEQRAVSRDDLDSFSHLIAQMIDFRCRFTATHSGSVAAVAEALGEILGWPPEEIRKLRVAGHLHDLGKLAVPTDLITKNGPLTDDEFRHMRTHAYHTGRMLRPLTGVDEIIGWAKWHHEMLDGSGYPDGLSGDTLPLGARVVATADIFTALTEVRPYRGAVPLDTIGSILSDHAPSGKLDPDVVSAALTHRVRLHERCRKAHEQTLAAYKAFQAEADI